LTYDGAGPSEDIGTGPNPICPVVVALAVNGTSGRLVTHTPYASATNSFALSNGSLSDAELGLFGVSGLDCGFFEFITAYYEGLPGSSSSVDAVTDYLTAKYFHTGRTAA